MLPRCHLPVSAVSYPAPFNTVPIVFSDGRSGGPFVGTPARIGWRQRQHFAKHLHGRFKFLACETNPSQFALNPRAQRIHLRGELHFPFRIAKAAAQPKKKRKIELRGGLDV